ncbi:hypothetical protein CLU81_4195 [Flavobacterium sp. 9]|nr:hypothetical protein CLU81_4195 [Flavobacterium sp. 9]
MKKGDLTISFFYALLLLIPYNIIIKSFTGKIKPCCTIHLDHCKP